MLLLEAVVERATDAQLQRLIEGASKRHVEAHARYTALPAFAHRHRRAHLREVEARTWNTLMTLMDAQRQRE